MDDFRDQMVKELMPAIDDHKLVETLTFWLFEHGGSTGQEAIDSMRERIITSILGEIL
jgi:hypothetical protein